MDEFELITRCFCDRTVRRPDTVLGIGDDAALLDTGGLPLAPSVATASFSTDHDDAGGIAYCVFGGALLRLAAHAVMPRWVTLGCTLNAADPDWILRFSTAAVAVCNASGVELIGGDTTQGPGRATVFALGLGALEPPCPPSPSPTTAVTVRMALTVADTPEHAIADLIATCTTLVEYGTSVSWGDMQNTSGDHGGTLDLVAYTEATGARALQVIANRHPSALFAVESHG